MAVKPPDLGLGFEAEVWWSRTAQPALQAWSDDQPVRRVAKTVPAQDPGGKAVACDGLDVPTAHQRLGRVVQGRPVSGLTCALLAWLATDVTAQGTRALVRIWDNASWHVSQTVRAWLTAHKRHATRDGGGRIMVCRFPSQRPWRNPLAPKWVHGKRAVVESARVRTMLERMQRVCTYYQCELTDPITTRLLKLP
jgi:hypothetical protein